MGREERANSQDSVDTVKDKQEQIREMVEEIELKKKERVTISEDDRFKFNLGELVKADFDISEDDEDFDLTQEQIIKVLKMYHRIFLPI